MKRRIGLIPGTFLFFAIQILALRDSSATMYSFNLYLSGSNVVPPVTSNGTAYLTGTYNDITNELTFTINFSLLSGVTVGAHFHGPASSTENAGTLINMTGFPLGVTNGTYSNTFVPVPTIETILLQGRMYVDIHTAYAFNGEIRTQMNMQLRYLQLTYLTEGMYNEVTNKMVKDTVQVNLRSAAFPYTIVDFAKARIDSTGKGVFLNFYSAPSFTPLYIQVLHRNGLELWSGNTVSWTNNALIYDFTNAASKAYGSNMVQKGSRFCTYSGDVNQDDVIDATDLSLIDNGAMAFVTGYVAADLNGDNFVDGTDYSIGDNNAANYITAITP